MSRLLEAANLYLAHGFSILPAKGKKAIVPWKPLQRRLPTDAEVETWFGDESTTESIAIVAGAISGNLVVRDFDDRIAYQEWSEQHEEFAEALPTVVTSQGLHVYFRVGCAELLKSHICCDGEYRSEGCYVIAPPSMHSSGIRYEWIIELPDAPIPIIDPITASLTNSKCYTEGAEDTEDSSHLEAFLCPSAPFCVTSAIETCTPTEPGQRHKCLFKLARILKSIPEYASAPTAELKRVFGEWHMRATPFIRTKPFETSWGEFLHAWKNVRHPYGESTVGKALARARRSELPPEAINFEQAELILLVRLCRELQRAQGDQTFFLDCRLAGEIVGVAHQTAWRWLRMLVDEGTLELVQRGSRCKKMANEYRYRGQM